jgi:transcriptional regulator with XRE-family HTH domain
MKSEDVRTVLGSNLKLYRNRRAMSQATLAEKAEISITFLSDIERGNKWPYMETLVNLASGLNIEVYELLKPEEALSDEANTLIARYLDDVSVAVRHSMDQSISDSLAKIRNGYLSRTPV